MIVTKTFMFYILIRVNPNDCIFKYENLRPEIRFSDKIKTLKLGLTFPPGKGKGRALMLDNLKPAEAILSTVIVLVYSPVQ